MTRRLRIGGLRPRLLVAFVLATVLGAGAAAWSSTRSGREALVSSNQQRITATIHDQVEALAPTLDYPPTQDTVDRLRRAVGGNTLVVHGSLSSASVTVTDLVTPELRRAVHDGDRMVSQQIVSDGVPVLLVGVPVAVTSPDGTRAASGIEVYVARDLTDLEQQVGGLVRSAVATAALALPVAVLLALLAAGSVLRPVRELRDTARRLAGGDLDARTPSVGSDELAQLSGTLNEMAESVQTSMRAMEAMQADARRFAADVSHELRTPLSTLTAVMEVLASATDQMEPDARESAELAITETRRLVRLAEDLMEVSRFDAGSAKLRLDEIDVGQAVRSSVAARGWLDDVDVPATNGILAVVDPRRLDVIMANLVGNALRHGEGPVRVLVSTVGDEVSIEVQDNGPGIDPEVLPHVFDRFYKADAARTRTPGSGLGLSIARENALLHGGRIVAENRTDCRGARFVVRLPRREGLS